MILSREMKRIILFEGKTTMGGMDVDLRIYRVDDENGEFQYLSLIHI